MPLEISTHTCRLILPSSLVQAMFRRAQNFSVEQGGRFDPRSSSVVLWTAGGRCCDDPAIVGAFYVRWRTPTPETATIWRLERAPHQGGSEGHIWRAMSILAGQPILPLDRV